MSSIPAGDRRSRFTDPWRTGAGPDRETPSRGTKIAPAGEAHTVSGLPLTRPREPGPPGDRSSPKAATPGHIGGYSLANMARHAKHPAPTCSAELRHLAEVRGVKLPSRRLADVLAERGPLRGPISDAGYAQCRSSAASVVEVQAGALYVDTSALVKLLIREAESDVVEEELSRWSDLATSVVTSIELRRAIARARSDATRVIADQHTILGVLASLAEVCS